MRHGFIKVACATPWIKVADCRNNAEQIISLVKKAHEEGVHLLVFPELVLTGATCQDLFRQQVLLDSSREYSVEVSKNVPRNMVVVFGSPLQFGSKVYDCAVVASAGKILGIVPKSSCNTRWFSSLKNDMKAEIGDSIVPLSKSTVFTCNQMSSFRFSCELGEDLFRMESPSSFYARNGANIIVNLSAFESFVSQEIKVEDYAKAQSAKLKCSYILANAGEGESTTDCVYAAQNIIYENGSCLAVQSMHENQLLVSETDLQMTEYSRRVDSFFECQDNNEAFYVGFDIEVGETPLTRNISRNPFVSQDLKVQRNQCTRMFTLQALGLKKRLLHTHSQKAVIGISGGLDSTLALLVAAETFDMMGLDRRNIICVTMPCFGTTDNTKNNAVTLVNSLGCTLVEINITESVRSHFNDIGQDESIYDTTFENSQARERTQVLMDLANKENGLVIGTGDLSELALGWATYNGDHMSMYSVNASIPKTVIRMIVRNQASLSENDTLRDTLFAILDTPVSPELVPGVQNTEELVGPYELHDFFIYHALKYASSPSKILRLAKYAFSEDYSEETIVKWLRIFYRRFFNQQFKRSCLPDGPKVTAISVSPRTAFMMPSDACVQEWKRELEQSLI